MKKVFLLMMVVALGAVTANAQWYAGGGLGFWNDSDAKTTVFEIIPEVGYNINSQWAVGTELGFAYQKEGDYKTNAFTVSPYARYTYLNAGKVNLFVDGGFSLIKEKDVDAGFRAGLQPGVSIALTEKFSLVSKFGFLGYSDTAIYDGLNGFGLALTNNVSFGFFVNF